MKYAKFLSLSLSLGLCLAVAAEAQTLVQTVTFDKTTTYEGASGSFNHVDSAFFTGTFNPFDSSLGELVSFQVTWTLSNTAIGTIVDASGGVTISLGGYTYIAGDVATSGGSNGSDGGDPGYEFSLSVPINIDSAFLVSESGSTYDPAYYNTVTGAGTFTLNYASAVNLNVSSVANFEMTTTGSVTLTYNYIPASAVPEPASFAAIFGGLVFAGTALSRRRRVAV
jgi:hypothetical protein